MKTLLFLSLTLCLAACSTKKVKTDDSTGATTGSDTSGATTGTITDNVPGRYSPADLETDAHAGSEPECGKRNLHIEQIAERRRAFRR